MSGTGLSTLDGFISVEGRIEALSWLHIDICGVRALKKFTFLRLWCLWVQRLLSCATAPRYWIRTLGWRFIIRILPWTCSFRPLGACSLHHEIVVLSWWWNLCVILSTLRMNRLNSLHNVLIRHSWLSFTHYLEIWLRSCKGCSWRTTYILFIALAHWNRFRSSSQDRSNVLLHLNGIFLVDVMILLLLSVIFLEEI